MTRLCFACVAAFAAILGITAAIAAEYKPPAHHAGVEHIARDIAYFGGNTPGGAGMAADPELRDALKKRGLKFREGIDDDRTGMQAMVLEDEKTKQTYIAFRGTWPNAREGALDAITDADHGGDTGSSQYDAHKARLDGWAQKYPNSVVTGHSLGGALGQRFIADHPDAVREGVLFNAPAVDTRHGHQFAGATKQPPITIYVGKTRAAEGTNAPEYDIVSELGGRSHLPAKIVEVTQTDPHSGFTNVLGTSHTAVMLSGKSPRTIEEIPYNEYQERREDSFRNAESTMQTAREALTVTEALAGTATTIMPNLGAIGNLVAAGLPQAGQLVGAVANIAAGFGKDGPRAPTPAMRSAGGRDCEASIGFANRAQNGIKGQITSQKLSEAELFVRWARDRSVGCPDALAKIASVESVMQASLSALRSRMQSKIKSCDPNELREARNEAAVFKGRPGFDDLAVALGSKLVAMEATTERLSGFSSAYTRARDAGSLEGMEAALTSFNSAVRESRDPACHAKRQATAESLLNTVNNLKPKVALANAAIAACNTDEIDRHTRIFQSGKSTVAAKVTEQLKAAGKKCSALHDVQCEKVNGPGWSFRKMANGGKNLTCVPNQAAANARCDKINKTSGLIARNIKSDGTFTCHKNPQQEVAEADAACRAQFKSQYLGLQRNSRGQLTCQHCPGGYAPRNGQCISTARAPAPQRHDPRNTAVAAAAAGAIIQGVIGAVGRSEGSSRAPTVHRQPNIARQPQVNRQPTQSRAPTVKCKSHDRRTTTVFTAQVPQCL